MTHLTAMMIQGNDVEFRDTLERSECWIVKNGIPHALMLSCPLDKRAEMEKIVANLKAEHDDNKKNS